jgi:hypothetical protein
MANQQPIMNNRNINDYSDEELQAILKSRKMSQIIQIKDQLLKQYRYLEPITNDSSINLLLGNVQLGKTEAMMVSTIIAIACHKTPVITFKNTTCDYFQFKGRFDDFIKQFNFEENKKPQLFYIGDTKIDDINEKLENPFNVPVLLANAPQTGKLYDQYQKLDLSRKKTFVVLCDEADSTMHNVPDARGEVKQVQDNLEQMRKTCKFVSVTATPWLSVLGELQLQFKDVMIVPINSDYKSINHLKWKIIKEFNTKKDNRMFDNQNIREIIAGFKIQGAITDDQGNFKASRVVLINAYYKKVLQESLVTTPETEKGVAYISFNGNGIIMKFGKWTSITLSKIKELKGRNVRTPRASNKIFTFDKSWTISEVLQIVEYRKIPVVFIAAKNLASRGINFSSITRKTHITDQVICDSVTDGTTRRQSLRILGRFQDDHALTVHTTKDIKNEILKEYELFTSLKEQINNHENKEDYVHTQSMKTVWNINPCKQPLVPVSKGIIKSDGAPGSVKEGISGINTNQKSISKAIEIARNIYPGFDDHVMLTEYYTPDDLDIEIPYIHKWSKMTTSEQNHVRQLIKDAITKMNFLPYNKRIIASYSKTHLKSYYNNPHNMNEVHIAGVTYGNGDEKCTNSSIGIVIRNHGAEDINPDAIIMWHDHHGNIKFDRNGQSDTKIVQVGKKSVINIKGIRSYPLQEPPQSE